jgi:hypothetical protein
MGELDLYNKRILKEIDNIKKLYGSKPQCYFLCLHLRSIFNGQIWYNMDHCLFHYRGGLYDHTGEVTLSGEEFDRYMLLQEYSLEEIYPLQEAMFRTNGKLEV